VLAVLRVPGVLAPAFAAALAALPIGVLTPAILVLVSARSGGFTAAGAVVALLGAGTVVGMLVQGRLIDRYGARPVVLSAAVLRMVASIGLVAVTEPAGVAALAVLVGAGEPQVPTALRASWPRLVGPALLPSAVALSTLLFEVPVMAGPLLLVGVLTVGPPEWAVLGAAVSAASGAVLFAASAASGHRVVADRSRAMGVPGVRWIVLGVSVQGMAIGTVQVAGAATGGPLAYALLTAASLTGTLVGARWGRPLPVLLIGLAGTLALSVAPWPFVIGVVLIGLVSGALGLACFVELGSVAPVGAPTAAVTVVIAAGLTATSVGAAVAGYAVDVTGPAPLLLALSGAALAVAFGWRRWSPSR
jgi:MFS family permease